MNVFEKLRECVDLVELADRFTELRPSGNTFCGCCPFPEHQDNTPSFYCYPDQRFHCFGCRRHGDAVDLWAVAKGIVPGTEAAIDLAKEYGVELPEMGPEDQKRSQEWWERRGFGKGLRERYLLGANGDGTEAIIPFWNRGRVNGLIRRKLEGEPKYVYPRSEEFPGGHRPLFIPTAVRAGAFLVEGIVDALALGALGESAIATGGTAISQHQMCELNRLAGPLYILPDADESGAEAAREWARELYPKVLVCPAEYGEGVTEGAS